MLFFQVIQHFIGNEQHRTVLYIAASLHDPQQSGDLEVAMRAEIKESLLQHTRENCKEHFIFDK